MTLAQIRDFIDSFDLSDHVYVGRLDHKKEQSIGVYHSKHMHPYSVAIGGHALSSYGTKYITVLVHWNRSLMDTERVTEQLFERLSATRNHPTPSGTINFIQLLYEPQDVGVDENGICEMVIEAAVIYSKKG